MQPRDHELKPLKPWAKIDLYYFKLICVRYFVTGRNGWLSQESFGIPKWNIVSIFSLRRLHPCHYRV
jgi:hypothetical protein